MKIPVIFWVICGLLSCRQKQESIDSVYDYIAYVVKTSSAETGPVRVEIVSGHLRIFGKSVAVITKIGKTCKIQYYDSHAVILSRGESITERDYPLSPDTTYQIPEKQLILHLAQEEELYKTRPVFTEVSVFIKVKRNNDEQDFRSRQAIGLTTIFKYNKVADKSDLF